MHHSIISFTVETFNAYCKSLVYKYKAESNQVKIILHRIISVVDLTSFSPETWTLTRHDEESKRLALSVKQSWNERVYLVSPFTTLRIVLLV